MDAIALLKIDHRTVEGLFRSLEGSPGDEEKLDLVREVIRELSIHASIEEQFLYPAVRRSVPNGDSLIDEGIEEHTEAEETLSELDGMVPTESGYDQKIRSLISDVRHHIEEEEGEMFPKLAAAVDSAELLELGERMERAKSTAPTRPHPKAPSRPPANLVVGAVAGVVDRARDRARDALTERRRARSASGPKSGTAKKTSSRKPTAKKTGSRKSTPRKSTARKSTARKSTARGPVYHVTPDPNGGWRAAAKGAGRALARGDKKSEVVSRARDAARSKSGRLVIHDAKGKIQDERTYGPDPRRSKG